MQYIISRHYENGKAKARITSNPNYKKCDLGSCYMQSVESIGEGGNFENINEWRKDMGMEFDDLVFEKLVLCADTDHWVDISAYV
ncbi:hypothetical protein FACS1894187_04430 [Synergistales bacterium]|nr:hypothetical protein FACS1894187_04430 [Synergistales bacterium]